MNIIYKLLNKNKYYIGSKVECHIEKINGVNTIIDNKTGNFYYGSSTSLSMIEDIKMEMYLKQKFLK